MVPMRTTSLLLLGLIAAREAAGFTPSPACPRLRTAAPPGKVVWPAPLTGVHAATSASSPLFMGWGRDPVWSAGTVESNTQACPSGSCVSIALRVVDGTGFTIPGQYVQVKAAGEEPVFLAIASAPTGAAPAPPAPARKRKGKAAEGDAAAGPSPPPPAEPATWEFLVKKTDDNGWLTGAAPGSTVDVSQVLGDGFALAENLEGFKYDFPTQNVLLFATGSGIAPLRSAIESNQLGIAPPGRGGRTCTLYYGVRTPDDLPYVTRFADWEGRGVQVVPVVSRPDVPCPSGAVWEGRTGYVQNALEEDGVAIPRNSAALLCGVKGMCESVKGMLAESGYFEGRLLTNF